MTSKMTKAALRVERDQLFVGLRDATERLELFKAHLPRASVELWEPYHVLLAAFIEAANAFKLASPRARERALKNFEAAQREYWRTVDALNGKVAARENALQIELKEIEAKQLALQTELKELDLQSARLEGAAPTEIARHEEELRALKTRH